MLPALPFSQKGHFKKIKSCSIFQIFWKYFIRLFFVGYLSWFFVSVSLFLTFCHNFPYFSPFHHASSNPYRWIFFILWTMVNRFHWVFTFFLPRCENLFKPITWQMCEKGGSTTPTRRLYISRPAVESIFFFIFSEKVVLPASLLPWKYATWRVSVFSGLRKHWLRNSHGTQADLGALNLGAVNQ